MQFTNSFGSFLVATLSASLAAGAVLPNVHKGSFEIKRVANDNFSGRNGPLALARAYAKYGVPVPEYLKLAIDTVRTNQESGNFKRDNSTGTAVATPDSDDLEYLVPVNIGTPAQTLNLDFDTGSSDLWVFSSETASGAGTHSIYTPSKSTSSKKMTGASWSITYGDSSSSSGDVYTDVVSLGGLTVESQAVEAAKKVSSQFQSGNNDGLLGLAFSSINTVSPTPQKTWFDNVKADLDAPLFVADLKHNTPGSYVFGSIPSAATDVLYAAVDNSQGFWSFTTTANIGSTASFSAIADTGTTLLLVDTATVKAYYAKVTGAKNDSTQGGYVYDCDTTLPDFTFTVGDGKITVPGTLINYAPTGTGNQCYGGLQDNSGIGFSIFGDIALKAAYVVFDAGNTQVGWAQKA